MKPRSAATARTYIGAMPGKIISAMITAKSQNPLILLDEIDKLAGGLPGRSGGSPAGSAGPRAEQHLQGPFPGYPV